MTYQALVKHGEEGAPLLLALHGTGGDEHQFFDLAQQLMPEATVVSPRGDVSEFGAARFFKRTGEGVYDMVDLARAVEKMAAYVRSFNHNGPIYGFGYSNGANILAATMMAHPKTFARVGLLHPLIPWDPDPVNLAGTRVLVTAGQADPITPWAQSQKLLQWLDAQGADVTKLVHPGGHEMRREELGALQSLLLEPVVA